MFTLYKDQEPHKIEGYRMRGTNANKVIMPPKGKGPLEVKEEEKNRWNWKTNPKLETKDKRVLMIKGTKRVWGLNDRRTYILLRKWIYNDF